MEPFPYHNNLSAISVTRAVIKGRTREEQKVIIKVPYDTQTQYGTECIIILNRTGFVLQ